MVELFTLHNCDRCPSVEEVLLTIKREVQERACRLDPRLSCRLLGLSGWADPYARKKHIHRHEAYGRDFGSGGLYTPQMLVKASKGLSVPITRGRLRRSLRRCRRASHHGARRHGRRWHLVRERWASSGPLDANTAEHPTSRSRSHACRLPSRHEVATAIKRGGDWSRPSAHS
ncbi:DUF1223 domain-containing protein [Micromonospora chokoriensis]